MNTRIKKLFKKVTSPFYLAITDVIELNDLRSYAPKNGWSSGMLHIRLLMPPDLDQIESEFGRAARSRFRERLTQSKGYLALDGSAVVGWVWITEENRSKEGVHPFFYPISPPKASAYLYDAFTAPAARHRGVMKALFRHVLTELKHAGIRCVFFTHDRNNTAINRLAKANGFIAAGTLTYHRRLWWCKQDITDLEKVCELK